MIRYLAIEVWGGLLTSVLPFPCPDKAIDWCRENTSHRNDVYVWDLELNGDIFCIHEGEEDEDS